MGEAAENTVKERGLQKTIEGYVSSNKMDKTIIVTVATHKKHPRYGKYVLKTKKYTAHDKDNSCQIGDKVLIAESRPLSKNKRWTLREIVEKAV